MASAGNTVGATTPVANYACQFTASGNVRTENIYLAGMSQPVTLASEYDYNNNRSTLAANIGGGTANFDYTTATPTGRFTGFSGAINDFVNTYAYDPQGDMTGITQTGNGGNGVTDKNVVMSYDADQRLAGVDMYQSSGTSSLVAHAAYGYDAASELTSLKYTTNSDGTGTVLAGYHLGYNAAGAVTDMYSYADTSDTSDRTSTYSTWAHTSYSYDPTAQLLGASYFNFTGPPATDSSVTYDPNGNRTANTTGSTISSTNRLLFDGTYYFNYDAAGNRTAKFISTSGVLDDTATDITIYTWNNANQLVGAAHYNTYAHYESPTVTAVGEYSITYGNDVFGRMVTRTAVLGTGSSTTTTTENFIYDGQNIVLILDGDGNVIERELTGLATDQAFASENGSTNTVNWYLTDNQGTVRDVVRLVSGEPTVENHLTYAAFGNLTGQTSSAAGDQPTFYTNGTWLDPQTGMNKMDARWADLVDAVFASYDPSGLRSGPNPFEFCDNSSPNFVDPSGLDPGDPPVSATADAYYTALGNGGVPGVHYAGQSLVPSPTTPTIPRIRPVGTTQNSVPGTGSVETVPVRGHVQFNRGEWFTWVPFISHLNNQNVLTRFSDASNGFPLDSYFAEDPSHAAIVSNVYAGGNFCCNGMSGLAGGAVSCVVTNLPPGTYNVTYSYQVTLSGNGQGNAAASLVEGNSTVLSQGVVGSIPPGMFDSGWQTHTATVVVGASGEGTVFTYQPNVGTPDGASVNDNATARGSFIVNSIIHSLP